MFSHTMIFVVGKKHQNKMKLREGIERLAEATAKAEREMKQAAKTRQTVPWAPPGAQVGNHGDGIYCKVCRTIICGGKKELTSHIMG